MMKLKKALTYDDVKNTKRKYIPFTGAFEEVFSTPQDKGAWLIWGASGSGKSSFVMQLVAELTKFYKVLYNSMEEDPQDENFFDRMVLFGLENKKNHLHLVQDSFEELRLRLDKKGSAKVVIIDSATYFFRGDSKLRPFEQYLNLKERYPNKLFIITAHGGGGKPRSELEVSLMYDADMKIYVDAYGAFNKGRKYGRKNPFIIWEEKYEELRGI